MFKFDFTGITRQLYKTDEEYARAVWRKNRARFNEPIKEEGFVKIFKSEQNYLNGLAAENKNFKKPTIRQVFSEMANREAFTSREERSADNLIRGLQKADRYKDFRNYIRDKSGKYLTFDSKYLNYQKETDGYSYYDPMMKSAIFVHFGTYEITILRDI